jgi:hypothetical protein
MPDLTGRIGYDGERTVEDAWCDDCGHDYRSITDFLTLDGDAYAILRAQLHRHDDGAVTYLHATFGTLWVDDSTDRVSFACRIGPVDGYDGYEAGLIDAASAEGDEPSVFGDRLTRERALEHALLPAFWDLVDWAAAHEPEVAENVATPPP